ncbi:MAG: DUF2892 domain-containing protein [Anaerolineales bacterium]|nr:DUF2892 domain-containing protein [Anaerolineales bacterium]MDW8325421.1 DUF2892 domain-containing protein [Anaerolineales bacterium]
MSNFFKVNEAVWDRALRILLGAVLLYLGWGGVVTGTLGVVLQYLGFVPLLTGIIGWCPLYSILKISTRGQKA